MEGSFSGGLYSSVYVGFMDYLESDLTYQTVCLIKNAKKNNSKNINLSTYCPFIIPCPFIQCKPAVYITYLIPMAYKFKATDIDINAIYLLEMEEVKKVKDSKNNKPYLLYYILMNRDATIYMF